MTTYVCRGCTPAAAARNSNPGKIAALAEVVHVNRRGSAGILVPPGGESDAPSEVRAYTPHNSRPLACQCRAILHCLSV